MSVLILDRWAKEAAMVVIEYARVNVLTIDDLLDMRNAKGAVGDDRSKCLILPVGYKVVYSIEETPDGKIHRLQIAHRDGKKVAPEKVERILELFDFTRTLGHCSVQIVEDSNGVQVINVSEYI